MMMLLENSGLDLQQCVGERRSRSSKGGGGGGGEEGGGGGLEGGDVLSSSGRQLQVHAKAVRPSLRQTVAILGLCRL